MKIGVSLLNWNNAPDTCACLYSLVAATRIPDLIVVWDNGSADDSVSIIKARFPDVVVIESKENIGFAAANNRVAGYLLNKAMDAVWILNNDTEVSSACLEKMSSALDANDSVSAVTGKIFYDHPVDCIWYAGGWVERISMNAVHEGIGHSDAGFQSEAHFVDFMSGCCMLIRSDVLKRIGLFNENYFAYYEDLDWSLRVAGSGGKLLYVSEATIVHKVSSSVRKNDCAQGRCSPLQHYLQARNHLYVIRTHADGAFQMLVSGSLTIARRILFAVTNLCFLRFEKVKAIFKGVRDGLGRMPNSGEAFI